MVDECSKAAYKEAKKGLGKKQLSVLFAIDTLCAKYNKCNDVEIAELLDWQINRVTPRRGELLTAGKIESAGKHRDPATNRTVNYWKVAENKD